MEIQTRLTVTTPLLPGSQRRQTMRGAFVWADSTNANFASDQAGTGSTPTGTDTFHIRATESLRLVTGIDGSDNSNTAQYLSAGAVRGKRSRSGARIDTADTQ